MNDSPPTVFIVDDDASVLKALARLVRSAGLTAETFASPREFLDRRRDDRPGCIVLDLRMPELSGLELQAMLEREGDALPVIFLSGHGDVPTSVAAMKAGAVDFLTKPCDERQILAAIQRAIARDDRARSARDKLAGPRARFAALTARERQVCELITDGRSNNQIAAALGTSLKDAKVQRARVMLKLGVDSLADLVRLVERLRAAATP